MAQTKSTAYWAKKFEQWWETTGSKQARARIPNELKDGYYKARQAELAKGKKPTPLTYNEGKEAIVELRGPNQGYKVSYRDTIDVKGANRRAGETNKTVSQQERQDWYRRNLYADPDARAAADFRADQKNRAALKSRIRQANKSIDKPEAKLIYEHLSPLAGAEQKAGGFESWRNVVSAQAKPNAIKSDKIADRAVLRAQEVPITRSGVIRADARRIPLPGTDESRFGAVLKDIMENQRPSARQVNKSLQNRGLLKMLKKIL